MPESTPPKQLSQREQQVITLLLQGNDNAAISSALGVSERAVKARLNRMFTRYGIHNGIKRVKLATMFYRRELCQQQGQPPARVNLTPRNQRIIVLVSEGYTNGEIAVAVGTTENAIKNVLRETYDKLGLWNRVELALWYEARRFGVR